MPDGDGIEMIGHVEERQKRGAHNGTSAQIHKSANSATEPIAPNARPRRSDGA